MIEIIGRLRKNMNGEVSERMAAHGVNYALNYGVAIHTLKELASLYAPDTKLAKFLLQQQVRDLQIMACYIADPCDVLFAEQDIWRAIICGGEMAEQLSTLIARSPECGQFVEEWIHAEDVNIRYCALLAAAKSRESRALKAVAEYVERLCNTPSATEIRVLATTLSANYKNEHIAKAIGEIRASNLEVHKQIDEEIYILEE